MVTLFLYLFLTLLNGFIRIFCISWWTYYLCSPSLLSAVPFFYVSLLILLPGCFVVTMQHCTVSQCQKTQHSKDLLIINAAYITVLWLRTKKAKGRNTVMHTPIFQLIIVLIIAIAVIIDFVFDFIHDFAHDQIIFWISKL